MRDIAERYGAIRWESGIEADDAIRAVRAFGDPNEAVRFVAPGCRAGERWAVIDLTTMNVVAEGTASAKTVAESTAPVRAAV